MNSKNTNQDKVLTSKILIQKVKHQIKKDFQLSCD